VNGRRGRRAQCGGALIKPHRTCAYRPFRAPPGNRPLEGGTQGPFRGGVDIAPSYVNFLQIAGNKVTAYIMPAAGCTPRRTAGR